MVLLSAAGRVEVTRAGNPNWVVAPTNATLAAGDRLRTAEKSRATLRMSDLSVLRLPELSTIEIPAVTAADKKRVLELQSGAAYFYGREKSGQIEMRTRTASGAVRGTEFLISIDGQGRTELDLIDGEVELSNDSGRVVLGAGETGTATPGSAPKKTAMIEAVNIIQWTLYYPAILDPAEIPLTLEERQTYAAPLLSYREGDLLGALEKWPAGSPSSGGPKILQAALLLAVGEVGQAEKEINASNIENLAAALRTMIAAVKLQDRAGAPAPVRASGWMAESYLQQSRSHLEAAREAARSATRLSPEFGFAWVRLAELEFSFGRTAEALSALETGLRLSPRLAQGKALRGFILLDRNNAFEARRAFDEAIALDGALANGWLGRGLARIRGGDAAGGRDDLLVAASLEPNRAVLRSYLGKAFSHLGDETRAQRELSLAKKLDARDPTSWLYAALVDQGRNRINDAVRELERSQELNENRSVYRSRFLLDQDSAVRSANLAAVYLDAGMTEVAAHEAARAVAADYGNFSAHLFLANAFEAYRDPRQVDLRYESPTVNEYLLANLLAPVSAGPLSPNISQQEYANLFERNHLGLAANTTYFSRGDWLHSSSVYGQFDHSAFSIDPLYRRQNGFRPNGDVEETGVSAQIKQQLSARDTVLFQAVYDQLDSGDTSQYYNPASASRTLRLQERQEPILLAGYRHEWAPGVQTLFLAGRLLDTALIRDPAHIALLGAGGSSFTPLATVQDNLSYRSDIEIYTAELQQIWQAGDHGLVLGGRIQGGKFETQADESQPASLGFLFPGGVLAGGKSENGFQRLSLYAYDQWRIARPLVLTLGAVYEQIRYPENFRQPPLDSTAGQRERIYPKLGLIWTPFARASVRAAYTRSLGGVSLDQSFRLEPTQVGGFNQTYRSIISESAAGPAGVPSFETWSAGIDYRFPSETYAGVEAELLNSQASRDAGAYTVSFAPPSSAPIALREHLNYQERNFSAHVNQLLGQEWSLGGRYRISQSELDDRFDHFAGGGILASQSTLQQMDLFAFYNHSCGFFAGADALWSTQSNAKSATPRPGDDFWQFNVFAGYRFPRRQAEVRLGVLNLGDRDYKIYPLNYFPDLPRERTFVASVKLNF